MVYQDKTMYNHNIVPQLVTILYALLMMETSFSNYMGCACNMYNVVFL